ncbi:MFS transporter [Phenylobacterium sp. SCN 70-31]|uniref:MFS transporter n=1 Tax=Phenylobacterium sp. SCN 70-31 TaxID=1660129 RepID=UPI0025E34DD1|nr:MFS transporter [Phenylobacterium sp. SCN 70-31]
MSRATATAGLPPLVESSRLRLLTVLLFYIAQGIPLGLFYVAIPAYMASSGATPLQIASVVGMTSLPWTLKLVNGFIIDRYTYLAMGRRRAWIIGAQATIVLGCLCGAVLQPGGQDVLLLSVLAFGVNMATTFQDVSIDSLAVDIMTEDEQGKAGGVMFGAQALGMSASGATCGFLIQTMGVGAGFAACAFGLALVLGYGIMLRERAGEKRLPWSPGMAHPHNVAVQVDAWLPLLKGSFRAILAPISLLFVPFLLLRAIPIGGTEVYYPVLTQTFAGWSMTQFTSVQSSAILGSAIYALTLGGWIVGRFGGKRVLTIVLPMIAAFMLAVGLSKSLWSNGGLMAAVIWSQEFIGITYAICVIPLAMRLCSPGVAATQFTIYMAVANFGRPLGASLSGATTGGATPEMFFFIVAAIFAVGAAGIWLFRPKSGAVGATPDVTPALGTAPAEH